MTSFGPKQIFSQQSPLKNYKEGVVNVGIGNSLNKSHTFFFHVNTGNKKEAMMFPLNKTATQCINFPLPKENVSILVSQTTYFPQPNSSFLYTTASWPSPISWNHGTAQDLGLKPKGTNQRRPGFLSHQAGQTLLRWGAAKSSRAVHNCAGQGSKITWHGKGMCPSEPREISFNCPLLCYIALQRFYVAPPPSTFAESNLL